MSNLQSPKNVKSLYTKELIRNDMDFCRRLIEYQMAPEMNWSNIHVDQIQTIFSFDVSKDEELQHALNWKKMQH